MNENVPQPPRKTLEQLAQEFYITPQDLRDQLADAGVGTVADKAAAQAVREAEAEKITEDVIETIRQFTRPAKASVPAGPEMLELLYKGDGVHTGSEPGAKSAAFARGADGKEIVAHLTKGPTTEDEHWFAATGGEAEASSLAPHVVLTQFTHKVDAKNHAEVIQEVTTFKVPLQNITDQGTHNLLSVTHPDTDPDNVVRGDLVTGQGAAPNTLWTRLALGLEGQVLTSDGTDALWDDLPVTADNHNFLSATHPDTTAAAVVRGDIVTGQGAAPNSKWTRLGVGTEGQVLTSDGTDAAWDDPPAAAIPSGIIVMWSGSSASIPAGWNFCDGTNGTPDLRNKFIVAGATWNAVTSRWESTVEDGATAKASGGSRTHDHDLHPDHYHWLPLSVGNEDIDNAGGVGDFDNNTTGARDVLTGNAVSQTHTTENHIPYYYVLAFIMKA